MSPGMPTPEFPFFDDITVNKSRFVDRAPTYQDWNQLISEITAHQSVLASGDYVTALDAIGDGVANDTAAIEKAIATGKNVQLDPNKTYRIRDTLTLQTGQTFDGRGATLLVDDQPATTVQHAIDHLATQFEVADASGFRVGDQIGILYDNTYYVVQTRRISRIVGNTIIVELPVNSYLEAQIPSGAHLYLGFYVFDSGNTGYCTIKNVNIDGNIDNQTRGYWTHTGGIRVAGDGCLVENCRLTEILGEGIVAFGNEQMVRSCRFVDLAGNGVHFSAGDHTTVDSCYFKNCGKNLMIQHNHGAVSWSALCDHVTIQNNWMEDCLAGLDGMHGNDESNVRIVNNYFIDNDNVGIRLAATVDGTGSTKSTIANNWFQETCVCVSLTGNNFTTEAVNDMNIIGNNFTHTGNITSVSLNKVSHVNVLGNNFDQLNQGTPAPVCRADGCRLVNINSNTIRGGSIGILVEGFSGADCKSCNIIGNVISGNTTTGIRTNRLTAGDSEINVSNNNIMNDPATCTTGWVGIACNSGSIIQGNLIRVDAGALSPNNLKGIVVSSGVTYTIGVVVQLNTVRGNPQYGIQCFGGTGMIVIQYNVLTTSAILLNSGGIRGTDYNITYTGTVTSGALQSGTGGITLTDGGSGWSGTLFAFFRQGSNSTASGSVTLTGGVITAVSISTVGSGYTTPGTPIEVLIGGNYVQGNFTLPTTG